MFFLSYYEFSPFPLAPNEAFGVFLCPRCDVRPHTLLLPAALGWQEGWVWGGAHFGAGGGVWTVSNGSPMAVPFSRAPTGW